MMFHERTRARSTLRALLIASGLALGVGGAMLGATLARAEAPASAPAFASDRITVEVVGEGPDVVLIPGLASSREVWRPTVERLAATHRLHLVQLRGFGGEPAAPDAEAVWGPATDEIARYIAVAGLERPAVIGHSMGGATGLRLAQDHPERVGRVLVVDALPFFSALYGPQVTVEAARPFAEITRAQMLAADAEAFAAMQAGTAETMVADPAARPAVLAAAAASDRATTAQAMYEVMTTDLRPRLGEIAAPVTVLYAWEAGMNLPPEQVDALYAREYAGLPGARLERVDGARHFIMLDQPAAFAAAVDAFLAE